MKLYTDSYERLPVEGIREIEKVHTRWQIPPRGDCDLAFLDEETWPERKARAIAQATQGWHERFQIRIGCYNTPPAPPLDHLAGGVAALRTDGWFREHGYLGLMAKWRAKLSGCSAWLDAVDVLYPSCYAHRSRDEDWRKWENYTTALCEAAQAVGAPHGLQVVPFAMLHYHPKGDDRPLEHRRVGDMMAHFARLHEGGIIHGLVLWTNANEYNDSDILKTIGAYL